MRGRLRVLLEMQLFNFLPTCHDTSAAADVDLAPHCVEVLMIDGSNVIGFGGESGEIVAAELVVVVGHGIGEATYDGFGDVCFVSV